jgi:hypothetical protein
MERGLSGLSGLHPSYVAHMVSCARAAAAASRAEEDEDKERLGDIHGRKGSACVHSRKAGGGVGQTGGGTEHPIRVFCISGSTLPRRGKGGHGTMDN